LIEYAAAMAPLMPKFFSFVLTFVVISIHWVNHHYLFGHLRSAPLGVVWLNNLLLLAVCFLPFPTAMLGDHPTDQFPILLYSANSLLAALAFLALRSYASQHKLFTDPGSATAMGPIHSMLSIIICILAIVLSFVNVYLSIFCLLLIPFLYFVPNLVGSHLLKRAHFRWRRVP
jgi:uncharacterized membrane protein